MEGVIEDGADALEKDEEGAFSDSLMDKMGRRVVRQSPRKFRRSAKRL